MNVEHEAIPIGDVLIPRNEKVTPADYPELPYIGLDDIEAHSMRLLGSKPAASMKSSAKRFYPGDVLYSRLRPYLNKVWPSDRNGICSSEFIVMPGNHLVEPRFLAFRINSVDFVSFANSLNAGDRPRVDFDQISSFCLPPFSLGFQRRIVAKIEELFSELDKGIESLKTAQAQLKVYRQSVLKHAFEGKLTAQWREENKEKIETPEQLLARIKQERKAADPLLVGSDTLEELPPLPEGYAYTYLANLGELGRGKSKHRPRNAPELFGGPYPFIQTGEVKAAGRIIREYSQT